MGAYFHVHAVSTTCENVKLRVAIIEAQALFTPFLYDLFTNGDFDVVYTSETVDERELAAAHPEVALIDIDFIARDVIAALRSVRAMLPDATICAYTGMLDPRWAAACTRAGANCVISKTATPSGVIDGILRAVRLGSFVDEHFDEHVNDAAPP